MKTIVQIFDNGQEEKMSQWQREQAVDEAIVHHAGQLQELASLLVEIFDQGPRKYKGKRARRHRCGYNTVDSDLFLPALRVLLKERYEIIDFLEDEYNRVHRTSFQSAPDPEDKTPKDLPEAAEEPKPVDLRAVV